MQHTVCTTQPHPMLKPTAWTARPHPNWGGTAPPAQPDTNWPAPGHPQQAQPAETGGWRYPSRSPLWHPLYLTTHNEPYGEPTYPQTPLDEICPTQTVPTPNSSVHSNCTGTGACSAAGVQTHGQRAVRAVNFVSFHGKPGKTSSTRIRHELAGFPPHKPGKVHSIRILAVPGDPNSQPTGRRRSIG